MSNSDRTVVALPEAAGRGESSGRRERERGTQRGKRRSQSQRTSEMRRRLLKAATTILRRHGYVGLRTEDVSRVAGVSRGAQLHHFPSKESLVLATTEQIFQSGTDRGIARANAALSSNDPLEDLIRDGSEFFFSDDFFVTLDLVLMRGKNQAIRDRIYEIARKHRPAVEAAWLNVLIKSGFARDDAEKVLWLTLAIVRGMAIRSLWQADSRLFRGVLDEWKAIVKARFPRRRSGRTGGAA